MGRSKLEPIPPVYLLLAVLGMLALHRWVPLVRVVPPPWNALGVVVLVMGVGFGLSGVALFRKRRTTFHPFDKPKRLVTEGPYRVTRNPMYLGLTVALAGLAVWLGTATPWVTLPLFVWVMNARVIPIEEASLTAAFGQEYRDYKSRVRRWI